MITITSSFIVISCVAFTAAAFTQSSRRASLSPLYGRPRISPEHGEGVPFPHPNAGTRLYPFQEYNDLARYDDGTQDLLDLGSAPDRPVKKAQARSRKSQEDRTFSEVSPNAIGGSSDRTPAVKEQVQEPSRKSQEDKTVSEVSPNATGDSSGPTPAVNEQIQEPSRESEEVKAFSAVSPNVFVDIPDTIPAEEEKVQ